jgi:hypothetical protein
MFYRNDAGKTGSGECSCSHASASAIPGQLCSQAQQKSHLRPNSSKYVCLFIFENGEKGGASIVAFDSVYPWFYTSTDVGLHLEFSVDLHRILRKEKRGTLA